MVSPIVFETQGSESIKGARIASFLWEGATTAGDTAEVRDLGSGALLWAGRATGVNTYIGINPGPHGVHAPNGFRAALLPAGRILVYLAEG